MLPGTYGNYGCGGNIGESQGNLTSGGGGGVVGEGLLALRVPWHVLLRESPGRQEI